MTADQEIVIKVIRSPLFYSLKWVSGSPSVPESMSRGQDEGGTQSKLPRIRLS